MTLAAKIKAKAHLFMPGDTITAAIKKHNLFDVTKNEMVVLLRSFTALNTDVVPKAGTRVMIPILPRHHDEVFAKKPAAKSAGTP
jgi:hypothetical protein